MKKSPYRAEDLFAEDLAEAIRCELKNPLKQNSYVVENKSKILTDITAEEYVYPKSVAYSWLTPPASKLK